VREAGKLVEMDVRGECEACEVERALQEGSETKYRGLTMEWACPRGVGQRVSPGRIRKDLE
jgi:hypothetical protein